MMPDSEGRIVSLVLVDQDGSLLGETNTVALKSPYWQETKPITKAFPGVIVLRLLSAEPSQSDGMGGRVTYLAQAPVSYDVSELKPCSHSISDHAMRMPWARPNGPIEDLNWAKRFFDFQGPAVQHRTWNLSAIWSLSNKSDTAWLKCVPPFFEHEAIVLKALYDFPVPKIIAHQDHRMLMQALPGSDGYEATQHEMQQAVSQLVEMQTKTLDRCDELIAKGVPHHSLENMGAELLRLIHSRAVKERSTIEFVSSLSERIKFITDQGIPECIVHGDMHPGNVRIGVSPPIIFDWGDSFIGHPFLDMSKAQNPDTLQYWLDCWQSHCPEVDVKTVWEKIRPIARLRSALVYENFCVNIEETERVYHANDIDDVIATYLD